MQSTITLYDLKQDGNVSADQQKALISRIANDEKDYQARLEYALFAFSSGQHLEAVETLFYIRRCI